MKSPVFSQIVQVISYEKFQKIVSKYAGDRYKKTFSSWNHLMLLLYTQIAGKTSLRDIINSLESKMSSLYHMGICKPSRNNLSHQNASRDSRIFQEFYYATRTALLNNTNITNGKKFNFKYDLKSIDSTTISLSQSVYGWADFRKNKAGIKMHTVLGHKSQTPEFIEITNARCNDAKALNKIPITSNSIYVMDRAYLSLKWLFSVVSAGSHFVIRRKINTKYQIVKRNKVCDLNRKKGIRFDYEIKFTGSKKYLYPVSLRLIKYQDPDSKQVYEYLTDNTSLSPFTMAEIYRDRWQIELFFKKIKQNLKIKSFIGKSENAVRIQIWVAMLVVLLYEWNKFKSKVNVGLKEFLSRVIPVLFDNRSMENILNGDVDERNKGSSTNTGVQLCFF
jgi:hypothetical protein